LEKKASNSKLFLGEALVFPPYFDHGKPTNVTAFVWVGFCLFTTLPKNKPCVTYTPTLQKAMGHSSINVSLTYLRGLEIAELSEEDMPMV
tara:strand:- start:279 stop:548 length:270 start_codon:yes stop_codon:yes gene_type:complete